MTKNNNDGKMVNLTEKQVKYAKYALFISVLFSIISVLVSIDSAKTANHANSIAEDANNISLTTSSHQKIIEESDLKIGTSVSGKNNHNETFIRVPIINGYYARYPASIIVERINIYLNDKLIKLDIEPQYNFIISKDNPTYFDFVFGGSNTNQFSKNIITIYLPTEKITETNNSLLIKIPYNDFTLKGNENKMIFILYYFNFRNGSIEVTERNVSSEPIRITEYKITI